MAHVGIKSILYRRLNKTNIKYLREETKNPTTFITFGSPNDHFANFLVGLSDEAKGKHPKDSQGWVGLGALEVMARLSIEAIEGQNEMAVNAYHYHPKNEGPALHQQVFPQVNFNSN